MDYSLKHKLEVAGYIHLAPSWSFRNKIITLVQSDDVDILEVKDHRMFYEMNPDDLLKDSTWSAYDRCTTFRVDADLIMRVTLFEGGLDGYPEKEKWSAKIQLKEEHLEVFEATIQKYFEFAVEEQYEKHLVQEKKKAMWEWYSTQNPQ